MFKITDLSRTITAIVGSVLLSATFVGAAVAPVSTAQANSATMTTVQAA